jgi:hypothetical protein
MKNNSRSSTFNARKTREDRLRSLLLEAALCLSGDDSLRSWYWSSFSLLCALSADSRRACASEISATP